jgi:hypothetical protein
MNTEGGTYFEPALDIEDEKDIDLIRTTADSMKEAPLETQLAYLLYKENPTLNDIKQFIYNPHWGIRDFAFFMDKNDFEIFKLNYGKYIIFRNIDYISDNLSENIADNISQVLELKKEFLYKAGGQLYVHRVNKQINANNLKTSELTDDGALEVLRLNCPDGYRIFEKIGEVNLMRWTKIDLPSYHKELSRIAVKNLNIPPNLNLEFKSTLRYYPILKIYYESREVSCFNFTAQIHVVANVEFHLNKLEYTFNFAGRDYTMKFNDALLGYAEEYLEPQKTGIKDIALLGKSIPIDLLRGISQGYIQPPGFTVRIRSQHATIYTVDISKEEITIPDTLVKFINSFNIDKNFNRLLNIFLEIGIIDKVTYQLALGKEVEPTVPSPPKLVERVGRKDKGALRKIDRHKDYYSYSQWGEFLGLTKPGAYRCLGRLQKRGLIELETTEQGTRATLTAEGRQAIE